VFLLDNPKIVLQKLVASEFVAVVVVVLDDDAVSFFKLFNAFTAVDEATSGEGYGIMNAPVADRTTFGPANDASDASLASDVGPNELTPRRLHLLNKLLSN
jgi:hypothetical protein